MDDTGSSSKRRSESSNKFFSNNANREHPAFCDCGRKLLVQTSWTSANPGRRFLSCPRRGGTACSIFYWYDPEMCQRSKAIIPGLIKRINTLESQIPLQIPVLVSKITDLESQLELKSENKVVRKSYHMSTGSAVAVVVSLLVLYALFS
ncbi:PREDICTED: uncharacterized protein At4g04775-like [Erythranthe guttata]|uniref:uncharacterized protein At4g04775-like n=1 Tax=Erythranthe guttata TaxID=4155 RepID=UPI00064D990E|nr:PREDICTED: uncharacterized protein At4g04775-like [Erythranthe guttata]|eukprot:XP_012838688.1 PREDICTED: uncharacterized protein At4g04775-like [Erythranthe guttata]